MRSFSCTALALALALLLASPRPARADGGGGIVVGIGATAGAAIGGPMLIGGLITALHNGVIEERPTPAWRNNGHVFGALNLAASVAWFVFAGVAGDVDRKAVGVGVGFGAAQLLVGGLGVGLTVAADRRPAARVAVTPLVLTDFRGGLTPGAGVRVVGF